MAQSELIVYYDPRERELYEDGDRRSTYFHDGYPQWLWRGIYHRGRFPEVAVRAALKALGFSVLISDPRMPKRGGYMLTHYAGKRKKNGAAFRRMLEWFAKDAIDELNQECDRLKRKASGNRGGGDPDLFVFSKSGDCFFVEVKDQDELTSKQQVTFPVISRILRCDVLLARVQAKDGATPGDGLRTVRRPANKALQPTSRARRKRTSRGRARTARG